MDKIVVDLNKLTITNKRFLEPESPSTIAITEVTSVTFFNAYIFASLEISYSQNKKTELKYLNPKKTLELKKIIDGLLVSKKLDLNFTALTDMSTKDLKNKFEKIGE